MIHSVLVCFGIGVLTVVTMPVRLDHLVAFVLVHLAALATIDSPVSICGAGCAYSLLHYSGLMYATFQDLYIRCQYRTALSAQSVPIHILIHAVVDLIHTPLQSLSAVSARRNQIGYHVYLH